MASAGTVGGWLCLSVDTVVSLFSTCRCVCVTTVVFCSQREEFPGAEGSTKEVAESCSPGRVGVARRAPALGQSRG